MNFWSPLSKMGPIWAQGTRKSIMGDLLKEYEGEDSVGAQSEVVGGEAFPQREESLIFNNLKFTIHEERLHI